MNGSRLLSPDSCERSVLVENDISTEQTSAVLSSTHVFATVDKVSLLVILFCLFADVQQTKF